MQCIHQVSMLLAEEGDEANAATATACPNLRPTNRPPVAAVQTLPRKAQEHEADQTLPRKAQDCKESPRSLNMLPRKTSSPPLPPHVPVHVFTGTAQFPPIRLSFDHNGHEGGRRKRRRGEDECWAMSYGVLTICNDHPGAQEHRCSGFITSSSSSAASSTSFGRCGCLVEGAAAAPCRRGERPHRGRAWSIATPRVPG